MVPRVLYLTELIREQNRAALAAAVGPAPGLRPGSQGPTITGAARSQTTPGSAPQSLAGAGSAAGAAMGAGGAGAEGMQLAAMLAHAHSTDTDAELAGWHLGGSDGSAHRAPTVPGGGAGDTGRVGEDAPHSASLQLPTGQCLASARTTANSQEQAMALPSGSGGSSAAVNILRTDTQLSASVLDAPVGWVAAAWVSVVGLGILAADLPQATARALRTFKQVGAGSGRASLTAEESTR